eukprot:Hpha_TRINITY_DN13513_c1_g1::TRINITY_DN13513_c1_g1_i1::g.111608::m.111608
MKALQFRHLGAHSGADIHVRDGVTVVVSPAGARCVEEGVGVHRRDVTLEVGVLALGLGAVGLPIAPYVEHRVQNLSVKTGGAQGGLSQRRGDEGGVGGVESLADSVDVVDKVLLVLRRKTLVAGVLVALPPEEPRDLVLVRAPTHTREERREVGRVQDVLRVRDIPVPLLTGVPAHGCRLRLVLDPLLGGVLVPGVGPRVALRVGEVVTRGAGGEQVPAQGAVADAALKDHDVVLVAGGRRARTTEVRDTKLGADGAVGPRHVSGHLVTVVRGEPFIVLQHGAVECRVSAAHNENIPHVGVNAPRVSVLQPREFPLLEHRRFQGVVLETQNGALAQHVGLTHQNVYLNGLAVPRRRGRGNRGRQRRRGGRRGR